MQCGVCCVNGTQIYQNNYLSLVWVLNLFTFNLLKWALLLITKTYVVSFLYQIKVADVGSTW